MNVILVIKKDNEHPKIRQVIKDGEDIYLKILNANFPIDLIKFNREEYVFFGVIVHYRTNLFDFNRPLPVYNIDQVKSSM